MPTAGQMLCCRGSGEPPAEVGPLRDPLAFRLRTGDSFFDSEVCIRTGEPLPWLMALDGSGREAVLRAVKAGWCCIGDDWVLPWADGQDQVPEGALPAVDAALDALALARTSGRKRFEETTDARGRALRRAQLVLHGAQKGWLAAEQARAALHQEREPLVRLALYSLFLPATVSEVSAGLRMSDGEVVGLAAVSLAHTKPRGALRAQVEKGLLDLLDTPLEGLFVALEQVGRSSTRAALEQRVGSDGRWRGARRDAGVELLETLRERAASRARPKGGASS